MTAHRHHVVRNGVENVSPIVATNICPEHPTAAWDPKLGCMAHWFRSPESGRIRFTIDPATPIQPRRETATTTVRGEVAPSPLSIPDGYERCGYIKCDEIFLYRKGKKYCCTKHKRAEEARRAYWRRKLGEEPLKRKSIAKQAITVKPIPKRGYRVCGHRNCVKQFKIDQRSGRPQRYCCDKCRYMEQYYRAEERRKTGAGRQFDGF